jgi:hypothetical protein
MKRGLPILIFGIFFLSQFGKVVNFCLCTINTYQQTGVIACDCEKQLSTAVAKEARQQDHQHNVLPPQADLLFHLNNSVAFNFEYIIEPARRFTHLTEGLYDEWAPCIFHPPGIAATI